jgi:hypothetical protein
MPLGKEVHFRSWVLSAVREEKTELGIYLFFCDIAPFSEIMFYYFKRVYF